MSTHVVPVRTYLVIFGALLVLTAVTVFAAFQDFGLFNTPIALTIAVFKATLVILYFMHVRHSSRLTWLFVAAGFFWLAIMLTFTLADFASRGWLPVYG
jgi:cytochrome c oxidase subunit 4